MSKLIIGTILTLGLVLPAFASAEIKIGFVDIRKAVEATSDGKEIKETLEKEFKKREKALKKQADNVKKMTEDYEKKSSVLSEDARLRKQQEIQEEMLKYNQDVQKNTQGIREKEQKLMKPVFEKMQKVINKIAEKEDYSLIIQNRDNVLFAKKEIDLTEKVVKAFEK